MQRFKPRSAIVAALRDGAAVLVEGDEGQETIKRRKPYDENKVKKSALRTTYTKGFGTEDRASQFDIEAFFAQFGAFNAVRLRRGWDKGFKGSVFVEWEDEDTAKKFMEMEPQPTWKGHDLLILWKNDYEAQKAQERKEAENGSRHSGYGKGRGGRGVRGPRGRGQHRGTDPSDWKKRRAEDQKNGFGDRHNGRYQGGGKRGRGMGRGGHHRSGDARSKEATVDDRDIGRPKIHFSKPGPEAPEAPKAAEGSEADGSANTNGKRSREDNEAAEEPPAKKLDSKETAVEVA